MGTKLDRVVYPASLLYILVFSINTDHTLLLKIELTDSTLAQVMHAVWINIPLVLRMHTRRYSGKQKVSTFEIFSSLFKNLKKKENDHECVPMVYFRMYSQIPQLILLA